MKQVIFLSIVLSFLSFFIDNEVSAADPPKPGPPAPPGPAAKPGAPSKPGPPAPPGPPATPPKPEDPSYAPERYCLSKCAPTVRPPKPFDVNKDVADLHKAMKGPGTDEKAIINILTKRGVVQRLQIHDAYVKAGHGSIVSRFRGELSGAYERSILALMSPLPMLLATDLQYAISPAGMDTLTMVEILGSISNFGIKSVAAAYQSSFKKSLEADIKAETTGNLQKALISLIQGKRDEGEKVDRTKVVADAQALSKPGPKNWKAEGSIFSVVFTTTRSFAHIREVVAEYKKITGHEIDDDIRKELPLDGFLAYLRCVKSKANFIAERLRESLTETVRDAPLIRILVSRSEIDLADIRAAYQEIYKEKLEVKLGIKIGGDYRHTLSQLITGTV